MRILYKLFILGSVLLLYGCSYTSYRYKEGPDPMKEERKVDIHFGPPPGKCQSQDMSLCIKTS